MKHDIDSIIKVLRKAVSDFKSPIVRELIEKERNPFKVLIATILSLRTKDDVTRVSSERLFNIADTPEKMIKIPLEEIEKTIYPVGFFRNKAETIIAVCNTLIEKYDGNVPCDMDELLSMKGVGRKTANLVLSSGFGVNAICVDTHVHRISNRLGYVKTKDPEETEMVLREKLPLEYWIEFNDLLVSFGQNICKPISPLCTKCPIHSYCIRVGVGTNR